MSKRVSNEPDEAVQALDVCQLSDIYVDESKNMRRFPPTDKEMKSRIASIQDKGQLQPVIVRLAHEVAGCKYQLVGGYQRIKAMTTIANEGMDYGVWDGNVLVRVVDTDDDGAIFVNLAENRERNSTSIIDLSFAIGELHDGKSIKDEETGTVTVIREPMGFKEISEQLGISIGYAGELDKMRYLRVPIQKKIHTGEITGKLARQLATMTVEEQDAVLAQVESGAPQQALAEKLQDKKADKKGKKRKAKGKGKGGDGGDGEGEGGEGGGLAARKPISAKKAILVFEELAAKPGKDEEGNAVEETEAQAAARGVFGLVRKFMEGKIGQQALQKNVVKVLAGE